MKNLEEKLGYKFKDAGLLTHALTHSSYVNDAAKNYERLEFLGDRVLGVAVAKLLCVKFPKEPEGSLSQRFVALVCKETVAEVARAIGVPPYIKIANAEIRDNENVLCDVVEAIIGAIFLDGGFTAADDFVKRNWLDLVKKDITPPKDAKTALQELAHVKGFSAPVYQLVSREGSEHEPVFLISVTVGNRVETGKGKNKKIAEQEAAKKMMHVLTGGA